jgi:hypothetical protein
LLFGEKLSIIILQPQKVISVKRGRVNVHRKLVSFFRSSNNQS